MSLIFQSLFTFGFGFGSITVFSVSFNDGFCIGAAQRVNKHNKIMIIPVNI